MLLICNDIVLSYKESYSSIFQRIKLFYVSNPPFFPQFLRQNKVFFDIRHVSLQKNPDVIGKNGCDF